MSNGNFNPIHPGGNGTYKNFNMLDLLKSPWLNIGKPSWKEWASEHLGSVIFQILLLGLVASIFKRGKRY